MAVFWNALDLFEQTMYCLAVPLTLLVVLQLILMCIGLGDGHGDMSDLDAGGHGDLDFDGDGELDLDGGADGNSSDFVPAYDAADAASVRLFTFQSILTFICIFSWLSLLLYHLHLHAAVSVAFGFAAGFAAMYLTAWVMNRFRHMNEAGNVRAENAVGKNGEVYLPIPEKLQGAGKVMVEVQGRLSEWTAMTEGEPLKSGDHVVVTDTKGSVLIVAKSV